MTEQELMELCSLGESTTVQYKLEFTTQKQIAEELVAFANTRGGIIVFGAEDKTGRMVGLTYEQVQYTSRELGNTANEHVRPIVYIETEIVKHEGMAYVVTCVKNGIYKPYKDLSGNIWVKQGSDKRRVTENSEIRRLLQNSHQYQVDADGVEGSSENDIDTKALDSYFAHVYGKGADDFKMPRKNVLRNAHITDDLGRLTIAGLMFFAKEPQQFRPQHCIKAVWFYGNEIGGTEYRDSRDITGTIPEMYEEAIRWLKSCLNRPQNGQSFNSVGELEIPEVVLEELVQNSIVHLDLLKPAAIRLLVFDNRIEIVNPGCLPDGQTIDEMLLGNSDPRNPLLAQFGSNTMPYRGLGSGIPRVMATGSDVELIDRPDGNQFVARIWRTTQKAAIERGQSQANLDFVEREQARPKVKDEATTQKANKELISTTQKEDLATQKEDLATQKSETTTRKPLNATQKKILDYLHNYPKATRKDVAVTLGGITEDGVKFNIGLLQQYGALKRKGGRKNGEWEVNPYYLSE
jgi:predicted HTH transcriptional regulator